MSDLFGDDDNNNSSQDFAKLLEQSLKQKAHRFEKGEKVIGEVTSIGKSDVFVSIFNQDGVVPRSELTDEMGQVVVKVGEHATLYVRKVAEDLIYLTAQPSSQALSETLEDAFDLETPVEGKVSEMVNGGFRVQIFGKPAFCPISQMDQKPISEPEKYIGRKLEFMVTKFEEKGRNIVVSRRKVLELQQAENEGSFLERHPTGSEVNGTVTRLETFGAFVEMMPGLEGLIHISEVGWSRIAHPSEVLKIGDHVRTKIIKTDEDDRGRLRISLSLKQVQENPWDQVMRDLKPGQILEGKIQKKEHFGFLVEVKPGIVGLLPKAALKESVDSTIDKKSVGQTLKVTIQSIDTTEHRIRLGLPRDQEDTFTDSYQEAPQSLGTFGEQFKNLFTNQDKKRS